MDILSFLLFFVFVSVGAEILQLFNHEVAIYNLHDVKLSIFVAFIVVDFLHCIKFASFCILHSVHLSESPSAYFIQG